MKKFNFHYFPRDFEAGDFIENFLVSAVANLLFWRFFLEFAGWPKTTFGIFYFPHVLWGGIFTSISLAMLLVYLNREAKYIASIVGGAGFGLFIDELGKYITLESNYFYEPTIAIIYVIFVIIFLIARYLERHAKPSEIEYSVNALEIAKNALMHDLDKEEQQKALYLLQFASKDDPIAKMLGKILKETEALETNPPGYFQKIKNYMKNFYLSLIRSKYFISATVTFFVLVSLINFAGSITGFRFIESFADWGQLIFSLSSGLLVLIGVRYLIFKSSRRKAYQMFKFSVLISIFLTQFFHFLENQLSAITILILLLIVLSVLQYLIYEESLLKAKKTTKA